MPLLRRKDDDFSMIVSSPNNKLLLMLLPPIRIAKKVRRRKRTNPKTVRRIGITRSRLKSNTVPSINGRLYTKLKTIS